MKELRRKTFYTIFAILSAILIATLVLFNIRSYAQKQEDIRHSLDRLDNRMFPAAGGPGPGAERSPRPQDGEAPMEMPAPDAGQKPEERRLKPSELENLMILDYELYTVEVRDGKVDGIYCLGDASEDFNAKAAAEEILANEKRDALFVENLYAGGYSYQYHYMESITILNNKEITKKLRQLLAESLLLFVAAELVIALICRYITSWIVKPAEQAFTRQKEFIADASHELKTPLAVIMASSDEMHSSEEDAKYLENIRYEADRMSRLIAGLLNLSKLEDGSDRLAYREEDLSRILEKTCLAFEGVAFEQGVAIETDIEEKLLLKCNKEEIEQMAATLLDNAVRHSHKDTSVCVRAKELKGKGNIRIEVVNIGDPIPKGEEEKIFERFYRGDKARGRSENRYGLGLAIARRIARNHNGDIRARSEEGETVFLVTLKNK